MRPVRPVLKFAVVFVVLVVAFVLSTMLAIVVSVNLSVPVQNSNRTLESWVATLQNRGYNMLYTDFRSAGLAVRVASFGEFENLLRDHEVTEVYWHWTQLAFPFQILYGRVWFNDQATTYFLETTW